MLHTLPGSTRPDRAVARSAHELRDPGMAAQLHRPSRSTNAAPPARVVLVKCPAVPAAVTGPGAGTE